MTEHWTRKPPIIYTIVKLQEFHARLQSLNLQNQLVRAKALLEAEAAKVKVKNARK